MISQWQSGIVFESLNHTSDTMSENIKNWLEIGGLAHKYDDFRKSNITDEEVRFESHGVFCLLVIAVFLKFWPKRLLFACVWFARCELIRSAA